MNIIEKENRITVNGVKDFNIRHIFDCGQCFRWNKEEDESYTGVVKNKVINVLQEGNTVDFNNINSDDFQNSIKNYFDFDTDYETIKKTVKTDDNMALAIKFGEGMRSLNQGQCETMISIMISANNRIQMI
ncbi:MAG: 8-oxoguanine DNA glycosylase, partial [Tissierellia bacterium]|nr:8-oxoguanine DNA glycosylase [Tissierellia bacterium]